MCSLMGVTASLLIGCSTATDSIVDRSAYDLTGEPGKVTFHVPGMNQRLQIL